MMWKVTGLVWEVEGGRSCMSRNIMPPRGKNRTIAREMMAPWAMWAFVRRVGVPFRPGSLSLSSLRWRKEAVWEEERARGMSAVVVSR